jgi:hypothetical protein
VTKTRFQNVFSSKTLLKSSYHRGSKTRISETISSLQDGAVSWTSYGLIQALPRQKRGNELQKRGKFPKGKYDQSKQFTYPGARLKMSIKKRVASCVNSLNKYSNLYRTKFTFCRVSGSD